ncbi:Cytochrome P450 monooxygenase [Pseudocercospora fuligena]|uniref:Cytochrome P450 monooxygenase n=1 Tax=Pseudocercospora fuligena TaxID=685502 RepID=A0A8H6RPS8_9PEZI|nr:Cytochrome P450 monooxygenase [Pseudocercospora fuligena]
MAAKLQDPGIDLFRELRAWIYIFAFLGIVIYYWRSRSAIFPVVNKYSWDFTKRKAHAAYMQDARGLVARGLKEKSGPITLDTPSGPRIVLPSSLTDFVKNNKDLNHQELVYHDFFGNYPGFEANAVMHNPDNVVIDTIRKKLSNNARLIPIMSGHVGEGLADIWGDSESWHILDWVPDTMKLVSRAAACAFAGEHLARDAEWQRMTQTYATNFFSAAFELKRWPDWTRPILHWFLPGATECRRLVKDVSIATNAEIDRRRKEKDAGENINYPDALTWAQEIAGDKKVDHGAIQLAFAMGALFTTSEALREMLIDLCEHQELIEPLRKEIREALSSSGVTLAALAKMNLMDSVMKESQRLGPPSIVGLERQATKDVYLPDGTRLPRGTIIAVDSSDMWDPNINAEPDRFDGYRYFKKRESGDNQTSFVSSTKEHNVFGMGKHICPGRFLANVEIKLCLAHILLKYDIRLQKGCEPKTIKNGLFQMVDPVANVEIRRRSSGDEKLL